MSNNIDRYYWRRAGDSNSTPFREPQVYRTESAPRRFTLPSIIFLRHNTEITRYFVLLLVDYIARERKIVKANTCFATTVRVSFARIYRIF